MLKPLHIVRGAVRSEDITISATDNFSHIVIAQADFARQTTVQVWIPYDDVKRVTKVMDGFAALRGGNPASVTPDPKGRTA